jgi:dihydrofolate reductase
MGRLMYIVNISLDGFIEDAQGNLDWSEPDDEELRFINDLIRPVRTHLYGRRLYETMAVWETDPNLGAASPVMHDFAELWRDADKVVYSRSLGGVSTTRTRIEPEFNPGAVAEMKATAVGDIFIGGAELAAHAIEAGLVDDYHFFVAPVVLGAGKPALPADVRLNLELQEERRFGNGVVYLSYALKT